MESVYVKGGKKLNGKVEISASKNAMLPILACSILSDDVVVLNNCSLYSDVYNMLYILNSLGVKTEVENRRIIIKPSYINNYFISEEHTKKLRSSIFMLGPLISKFKFAKVAYPGGCNIGTRPIDLHLKGLKALNVKIEEKHGYIYCDGRNMRANNIHLDFPSVGATENLIMASVFLSGTTTIYNAAKEPEIVDLQNFLNRMGAKVCGAGTSTITICGVRKLSGLEYTPLTDRIVCGTYLIATALTGGKVRLENTEAKHNLALIFNLQQAGAKINYDYNSIEIECDKRPKSIEKIETMPYPGFPTDLQSQILTLQTISLGTSVVVENLYETRFKIYTELKKMGANITIKDRTAICKGVNKLWGANVVAPDLRGGASLVLAGLVAEGYTTIEDVFHIDRGYFKIENDLNMLGADVKRITY